MCSYSERLYSSASRVVCLSIWRSESLPDLGASHVWCSFTPFSKGGIHNFIHRYYMCHCPPRTRRLQTLDLWLADIPKIEWSALCLGSVCPYHLDTWTTLKKNHLTLFLFSLFLVWSLLFWSTTCLLKSPLCLPLLSHSFQLALIIHW